jgi:hypothetical protein
MAGEWGSALADRNDMVDSVCSAQPSHGSAPATSWLDGKVRGP